MKCAQCDYEASSLDARLQLAVDPSGLCPPCRDRRTQAAVAKIIAMGADIYEPRLGRSNREPERGDSGAT